MSCRPPTRPDLPRQAPPQVDGADEIATCSGISVEGDVAVRVAALHDDIVEAAVRDGVVGHDPIGTLLPDAVLAIGGRGGVASIGVRALQKDLVGIAEVGNSVGLTGIDVA